MRYISVLLLIASLLNCNSRTEKIEKGTSPIILKNGEFVNIKLNIRSLSKSEIYADIEFTNRSADSFLFYKALLPINGEAKAKIFSLFVTRTFEQIKYIGIKDDHYLMLAPDDDEGVIVPDLEPDRFIKMPPMQTLKYTINLSKFYDFSKIPKGTSLSLTYSNCVPEVSLGYKQITDSDKIDDRVKPAYYDVGLAKKVLPDSMRVQFLMN